MSLWRVFLLAVRPSCLSINAGTSVCLCFYSQRSRWLLLGWSLREMLRGHRRAGSEESGLRVRESQNLCAPFSFTRDRELPSLMYAHAPSPCGLLCIWTQQLDSFSNPHDASHFPRLTEDVQAILVRIENQNFAPFYGSHFGFHYAPRMKKYVQPPSIVRDMGTDGRYIPNWSEDLA